MEVAFVVLPLLLVALFKANAAIAQRPEPRLQSGTRVRLIVLDTVDDATGEPRYIYPAGTIAGFDPGSLILRPGSSIGQTANAADTLRIPVTNITSGEALTGRKRHTVHGAIAGLMIGAMAGYALAQQAGGGERNCVVVVGPVFCNTLPQREDTRLTRSAAFAGIGALAGATVGHFIQTERWAVIDVANLRLQFGLR